jgi:hypothetical protein
MGIFGKKKEIRFESITIDRQTDVFRALENRGWTLCSEPFKFDLERATEKIRKDALNMAKDLKAELLVETWDPIYHNKPYKGLSYSAWRPMTQEEAQKKRADAMSMKRPDYSDSLGEAKLNEKPSMPQVSQEDMRAFESVVAQEMAEQANTPGVHPSREPGYTEPTETIKAISAEDPYHHRGESASSVLKDDNIISGGSGPLFEQSMHLELGAPDTTDPSGEVDAMALMMDAAEPEEKKKVEEQEPV